MDSDALNLLRLEAKAILRLRRKLEGVIDELAELCYNCRGRIIVTGLGKSGIIARKLAATLASVGTSSYFVHAAEAAHGDLGIITTDDIVIALSKSGRTEELLALIPNLKRLGVKLVVFTADATSPLAREAHLVVDIGVDSTEEFLGFLPTTSAIATMAAGDVLVLLLMKKSGIDKRKFANFHPGGTLGKLLKPVSEIMHKGEEIPKVGTEATLMEGLIEMSSKKLGVTLIVEADGRLAGIYTDGDIRRTVQKNPRPELFSSPLLNYATRSPKYISPDILVDEAILIMEQNKITSLPVLDRERKVIGLVHLHDLISLKVI